MTENLTERERQILEHLKQAEQLGSTLTDYARAFNVNVQELYSGKAALQRKGVLAPKSSELAKAELLAVQVEAPTENTPDEPQHAVCRFVVPGGGLVECWEWPTPEWLSAVMGRRTS